MSSNRVRVRDANRTAKLGVNCGLVLLWLAIIAAMPLRAGQAIEPFSFAWLSDTHIGSTTAAEDLRTSVGDINSMTGLAFVVVSGDVTEYGSREQLRAAREILADLKIPSHVIPGNHDTKWSESGATDFGRIWGDDRFYFERGGIVFIGMHQGPLMRMGDGHWAPEDVRWLARTLSRIGTKKPLIFITHYPIDNSIANWWVVLDMLKQHNTQAVLCGHGHANRTMEFEGVPGAMGRSNLRARSPGPGFNVVSIDAESMSIALHLGGRETESPWLTVPMGRRDYCTAHEYPRPDFSTNRLWPRVKIGWEHKTGFTIAGGPAVWKDLAIVGDASGTVTALDIRSGRPRWKHKTGGAVYTTPAVNGGRVFVTSTDGSIYALKVETGRRLWRHALTRPIVASPLAAGDRVYTGSSEAKYVALDAATGKEIWSFGGVKGFIEARPLMHDGKVIFGAWDQHLYALDAGSGTLAWAWKSDRPGTLLSPAACEPVAARGKVFIAAPDRFLTAIDAKTGATLWRTNQWVVRETLGLSGDGQRAYVREMNDKFAAIDTAAPGPRAAWTTNAGFGYDINAAQIVERDDLVYYGTKNGMVMALDGKTGAIVWKHKMGVALVNTLAPLASGKVLATDFDGRVVLLSEIH